METIQSKNMETLVTMIFSKPPRPPCTYTLMLPENVVKNQVTMFQLLMNFLIAGAKHLYGNCITPEQISEKQFQELKYYIESVGYMIKYNYQYLTDDRPTGSSRYLTDDRPTGSSRYLTDVQDENSPRIINIWFEKYFEQVDCHGRKIFC